jgi:peptidoglycan/LPS O-acetylase OafA/YrhL
MPQVRLESAPHITRIPSLDGLRAFSILLVVSLHTLQRFSINHQVSFWWYALFNGADGVWIFFVISGFLITSLLLHEQQKRGAISLGGFYLRRAFRILPPLYFYIGVIVAIGLAGRAPLDRTEILSSLFFFHNFASHGEMWPLEHLWSISVEEQFYLIWPCILFIYMKKRGIAGRSLAAIPPAAILVISPFARVLLGHSNNALLHNIGIHCLNFDFIMFGCLLALLQDTPRFESFYRYATRFWWATPVVMIGCSIASARYQNYFDLPIGYTINGTAIAIFVLWCARRPSSAFGRILNSAPVVRIGVLSYSIYLWQTLFLHPRNFTIFRASTGISNFPGNWVGFFLAAFFSYYIIEQPSLRLRSILVRRLHIYAARRTSANSTAR